MRSSRITKILATSMLGLASASPALAAPILFDLEGGSTAATSSLSFTVSGLTMTITRSDSATFRLDDLSAGQDGVPADFGSRTLSPFTNTSGGAFVLTFSQAISAISVVAGDYEPSDVDTMILTVGSSSSSVTNTGSGSGFVPYSLSLGGINGFVAGLSGGSSAGPQSVYWDNIRVELAETQVPTPGTAALAVAALLAGAAARRRRR